MVVASRDIRRSVRLRRLTAKESDYMNKCVCGNTMVPHQLRPDRVVCKRCGRTKLIDDNREKLRALINELNDEEVDSLIRILEERY